MTAPPPPSFEERLAALRADWSVQLPGRLQQMRDRLDACSANPQDQGALEDLHRMLHSLAGSAGTFGMPALSQQARAIEHRLQDLVERPSRTQADVEALRAGVAGLRAGEH